MDSRARMMLDALNLPSAPQQSQQPAQPMRYATGGMVGLPSLADLARPDFNWSSLNSFAPAPSSFTPMTQNVPLFVAQSPAYGNMGQDVYDWKAPTATAAPQPYSTVNQPVAQTVDVRVPTSTAVVDVPMPGVSTPTPNVPTMPGTGTDMSPLVDPNYLNPQPTAPAPTPTPAPTPAPTTTTPTFTPVTNPMGPDPFEVRRSEAAAELEAFNQRQAEEAARMAEAKRVADAAAAAQAAEDARLARLAEEKRVADKLLSDTQQQQAAMVKREEERVKREAEAAIPAPAPAPAPVPAPVPERQFVTTNYESGEGYYTEGAMSAEDAAQQQFNQDNSWYAGDGG